MARIMKIFALVFVIVFVAIVLLPLYSAVCGF